MHKALSVILSLLDLQVLARPGHASARITCLFTLFACLIAGLSAHLQKEHSGAKKEFDPEVGECKEAAGKWLPVRLSKLFLQGMGFLSSCLHTAYLRSSWSFLLTAYCRVRNGGERLRHYSTR